MRVCVDDKNDRFDILYLIPDIFCLRFLFFTIDHGNHVNVFYKIRLSFLN